MAYVVMFPMWCYDCPSCEVVVKAPHHEACAQGAESHMGRHGQRVPSMWDPPLEKRMWAFNVRPDIIPDASAPPGSPGAPHTVRSESPLR